MAWRQSNDNTTYVTLNDQNGELLAYDIDTGDVLWSEQWPLGLSLWGDLEILGDRRIAALTTRSSGDPEAPYSLMIFDPAAGTTEEYAIGSIERWNSDTGVFDGETELVEHDTPGVAWGDDRVYIVHADEIEITSVDLHTGEISTRVISASSWLDRVLAYWFPTAQAKGPSLGTFSSAALSADGRFLFVSGNRSMAVVNEDGSLTEETIPLGLIVIDTETGLRRSVPDLAVQFAYKFGETVVAVDTQSLNPWVDHYFVLGSDSAELGDYLGPFEATDGWCEPRNGVMVCSEISGGSLKIEAFETATGQSLATRTIGREDGVAALGFIEDRPPFED